MEDAIQIYEKIKAELATLPAGYISKKNIKGNTQYYLQWNENGKLKSKYIRKGELEIIEQKIARRKELEAVLEKLMPMLPERINGKMNYETNVLTCEDIRDGLDKVRPLRKRDAYPTLLRHLYSDDTSRITAVYGLRRTGKTTMLYQAMAEMSKENQDKTVYIKLLRSNTMAQLNRDLYRLKEEGYRYVFIDEVTLANDFIDSASLFSDVFAPMGMHIVLSGTDSLGIWFAEGEELYDRVNTIHTTFIPYREYNRLLGIDSIDEYIRYGGTFRMGETDYDDEDLNKEDASFRDDETTRRYVDTAIAKNIQHSLACYENGGHFRRLHDLYEAGELTNAINRIVEDMNHRFVLSVLTKEFTSSDFGISAKNLRTEKYAAKRTDILDEVDRDAVTKRMMEILDIRNKEDLAIGIRPEHIAEIKEYLKALDLIINGPTEYIGVVDSQNEHILFAQPGMRYCQAQALVHSLMKDTAFAQLSDDTKQYVSDRILEEVRGRMMKDIILLETAKALGKQYRVFKLEFTRGEFDMVIRDNDNNSCAVYEIKHSTEIVPEQARHLTDEEKLRLTSARYGEVVGRFVLYRGADSNTENGIAYRNVEEYLKALPDINLHSGLEKIETESENQDFHQTM